MDDDAPDDAASPGEPAWDVDGLEGLEHPEDMGRIRRAAFEAELDTGARETTYEEARENVVKRIARITLGFIVLFGGILAIPLPGPGWLLVAAGLAILAQDFVWADRLLRYVRRRIPGIPEDGKIPRSSMVMIGVVTISALVVAFFWGDDIRSWLGDINPWGGDSDEATTE